MPKTFLVKRDSESHELNASGTIKYTSNVRLDGTINCNEVKSSLTEVTVQGRVISRDAQCVRNNQAMDSTPPSTSAVPVLGESSSRTNIRPNGTTRQDDYTREASEAVGASGSESTRALLKKALTTLVSTDYDAVTPPRRTGKENTTPVSSKPKLFRPYDLDDNKCDSDTSTNQTFISPILVRANYGTGLGDWHIEKRSKSESLSYTQTSVPCTSVHGLKAETRPTYVLSDTRLPPKLVLTSLEPLRSSTPKNSPCISPASSQSETRISQKLLTSPVVNNCPSDSSRTWTSLMGTNNYVLDNTETSISGNMQAQRPNVVFQGSHSSREHSLRLPLKHSYKNTITIGTESGGHHSAVSISKVESDRQRSNSCPPVTNAAPGSAHPVPRRWDSTRRLTEQTPPVQIEILKETWAKHHAIMTSRNIRQDDFAPSLPSFATFANHKSEAFKNNSSYNARLEPDNGCSNKVKHMRSKSEETSEISKGGTSRLSLPSTKNECSELPQRSIVDTEADKHTIASTISDRSTTAPSTVCPKSKSMIQAYTSQNGTHESTRSLVNGCRGDNFSTTTAPTRTKSPPPKRFPYSGMEYFKPRPEFYRSDAHCLTDYAFKHPLYYHSLPLQTFRMEHALPKYWIPNEAAVDRPNNSAHRLHDKPDLCVDQITPISAGAFSTSGLQKLSSVNSLPPAPPANLPVAPLLNLIKDQSALPGVEVINGGYGIKNPSFSAPKAQDFPDESLSADNSKFVCKFCSKEFSLQRLLNRHLKCHSDVKRYLCTFCGKGFNDTFDLKRHTRIHTGVKPYKCPSCDKSFTQRCSLESHTRKVHGADLPYGYKQRRTKVYVCEDCGHSTSDPENHFVHLQQNHPFCPALARCHDKRQFKFRSDGIEGADQREQERSSGDSDTNAKTEEASTARARDPLAYSNSISRSLQLETPTACVKVNKIQAPVSAPANIGSNKPEVQVVPQERIEQSARFSPPSLSQNIRYCDIRVANKRPDTTSPKCSPVKKARNNETPLSFERGACENERQAEPPGKVAFMPHVKKRPLGSLTQNTLYDLHPNTGKQTPTKSNPPLGMRLPLGQIVRPNCW
ncbi:uncharacterized protein LOC127877317 isoform X1 [Dreissena polymorpha]|uniref:uncharacterized protein LOC127877317 isoform X1 n=2 Tax=Dreissena polymorpha TaxID=45954 RepID=UPI002263ADB8|nr:uncharacterized protein LOC127877317 isoform X1 [Dreissena polymorpha]